MSDPANSLPAPRAPYCLRCFHQEVGEHDRCPECGKVSPPSQRGRYWTLHPRMRALERGSKVVVTVIAYAMLSVVSDEGTWLGVLPIAFAFGGWKTAEKWTRRDPYFDAHLVWITTSLLVGGAVGGVLIAGGRIAWGVAAVVGFLLLAAGVHVTCVRAGRWKLALMRGERRIGGGARGASG